ncbi:2-amino-4-hydroxy-6-hydroxymethyldihydropteridine diphosphokinase [Cereibacter changlensis]|uniref:2-amino-4-hydroxy-6-hydroxymethyldihydropteridine pyrophosphokinase n=1 Tax=Cereibacter changlensis TaxID=402884 RepID=A0A4U0Z186_9RHOB|nr:2-amino-4-hydroxy-6-hydroxymethyldihydropteridine diphosphokinase [Cereibacter changlensis]TKA96846.1 2-amino-4-hydroxy-6-hydroxymethyldihydropteridine diphosphokinase [Cereibacter changlensis]
MPDPSGKHALVAFGANVAHGDQPPTATIRAAFANICERFHAVGQLSRLHASPCFPVGAGPDYVNAAGLIIFDVQVDAAEILSVFHGIEAAHGRRRLSRWGARTLDIDLLAVGDSILPDRETQGHWRCLPPERQAQEAPDRLILPHPRMQDRAFVLVPLQEVAPVWRHPILGLTVSEMLAALPVEDRDAVRPLPG